MAVDWEVFAQFGIAGLILGVFGILILLIVRLHAKTIERMSMDHKESSEAWRLTFEAHNNRADLRQAETNTILRDLTGVISQSQK